MKLLLKSALVLLIAVNFGCSTTSKTVENEPAGETTAQASAQTQATPDPAISDNALDEVTPENAMKKPADTVASALVGTEWSVFGIAGTDVVENTQPTLLFAEDGKITGLASCNRFYGTYETTDSMLTIIILGITRKTCPPPIMDQEKLLLETLNKVDSYQIDADGVFTLNTADSVVVTARR